MATETAVQDTDNRSDNRPLIEQVGDRFHNGEWIEEVISDFCVAECDWQIMEELLWSVSGLAKVQSDHERRETKRMRGLPRVTAGRNMDYTEEQNRDWHERQLAGAMGDLDAFMEKRLPSWWKPFRERWIEQKTAALYTEAIGEVTRDVFEEAMSGYENWLDEHDRKPTDEELCEMARADGMTVLADAAK